MSAAPGGTLQLLVGTSCPSPVTHRQCVLLGRLPTLGRTRGWWWRGQAAVTTTFQTTVLTGANVHFGLGSSGVSVILYIPCHVDFKRLH
jgi:hypothetical protein